VADRRGDIYLLQGKRGRGAQPNSSKAYKGLDERSEYRRLVEIKLNALGSTPKPAEATPTAGAKS
jgi:predicted negative regulator of RcsB-dependent stress response